MKLSGDVSEGAEDVSEGADVVALRNLARTLGMVETSEMVTVREHLIRALQNSKAEEEARALYARYEHLAEQVVAKQMDVEVQIGYQLLKAVVFKSAGNEEFADHFLYDAIVDAANARKDNVADMIRAIRQ